MVTLLVDPQQARDLQAARDAGELSLSLRNPHDASLSTETGAPVPVITGDDDETPRTWQTTVIRGGRSVVETFTRTDNGFQTPQAGPDQHANNDAHEDPVDE
jgi:Flp pilus assembly protein CpaB